MGVLIQYHRGKKMTEITLPEGVDVKIIREDQMGRLLDMHVNCTSEGIIADVVGHRSGEVIATGSMMFDEMVGSFDPDDATIDEDEYEEDDG